VALGGGDALEPSPNLNSPGTRSSCKTGAGQNKNRAACLQGGHVRIRKKKPRAGVHKKEAADHPGQEPGLGEKLLRKTPRMQTDITASSWVAERGGSAVHPSRNQVVPETGGGTKLGELQEREKKGEQKVQKGEKNAKGSARIQNWISDP